MPGPRASKSYVLLLGLLVATGLLLRLVMVVWIPTVPASDFWSYFQRAANLADHRRYEAIAGHPDATFPPAYSALLSLLFSLTGHRLVAAKLLNSVLGGCAILLTAMIAWRLFGQRAALVSGAMVAYSPRHVLMPLLVASENLFLPLLLVWTWIALAWLKRPRSCTWAILVGAVLGVLALTRSVAYLLWVVWPLAGLAGRRRWRIALVETLLLVSAQHAVMVPWALRNREAIGTMTFLTSTSGINLFIGNNERASGGWYPWMSDLRALAPGVQDRSVMEQNRVARRAALAWMAAHPRQALGLYLRKWRLMFESEGIIADFAMFYTDVSPPWPATDVLPGEHLLKSYRGQVLAIVNGAYRVLLLLEILGGLLWIRMVARAGDWHERARATLLLSAAAYFPVVTAVFLANPRFHWPTVDLLVPVAGLTVQALVVRWCSL